MPQQPQLTVSPGDYWFYQTDKAQKGEVFEDVGKLGADLFATLIEAGLDATGVSQLPPDARLDLYRNRSPEDWDWLRTVMPQWYTSDQADFRRLAQRKIDSIRQTPAVKSRPAALEVPYR